MTIFVVVENDINSKRRCPGHLASCLWIVNLTSSNVSPDLSLGCRHSVRVSTQILSQIPLYCDPVPALTLKIFLGHDPAEFTSLSIRDG